MAFVCLAPSLFISVITASVEKTIWARNTEKQNSVFSLPFLTLSFWWTDSISLFACNYLGLAASAVVIFPEITSEQRPSVPGLTSDWPSIYLHGTGLNLGRNSLHWCPCAGWDTAALLSQLEVKCNKTISHCDHWLFNVYFYSLIAIPDSSNIIIHTYPVKSTPCAGALLVLLGWESWLDEEQSFAALAGSWEEMSLAGTAECIGCRVV